MIRYQMLAIMYGMASCLKANRGIELCMKTSELLHKYVAFISARRSAGTVKIRSIRYRQFCAVHGDTPVERLTHATVYDFCTSDGAARVLMQSLSAALHWAARSGLIKRNPMAGIEQPPARSRGREAVLSDDDHAAILQATSNHYNEALHEFIIALENTGARPGEIAAATAASFSAGDGAIVYHGHRILMRGEHRHKTSGRDRERLIFLTGGALELVRKLARRHASGGVLFRNRFMRPWTPRGWCDSFSIISERLSMPHLTAYSYRHTFATRWLLAGKPVEVLAELMGNTPHMIHKHYAHLLADKTNLRAQLEDFRRKQTAGAFDRDGRMV